MRSHKGTLKPQRSHAPPQNGLFQLVLRIRLACVSFAATAMTSSPCLAPSKMRTLRLSVPSPPPWKRRTCANPIGNRRPPSSPPAVPNAVPLVPNLLVCLLPFCESRKRNLSRCVVSQAPAAVTDAISGRNLRPYRPHLKVELRRASVNGAFEILVEGFGTSTNTRPPPPTVAPYPH